MSFYHHAALSLSLQRMTLGLSNGDLEPRCSPTLRKLRLKPQRLKPTKGLQKHGLIKLDIMYFVFGGILKRVLLLGGGMKGERRVIHEKDLSQRRSSKSDVDHSIS